MKAKKDDMGLCFVLESSTADIGFYAKITEETVLQGAVGERKRRFLRTTTVFE
jgi:hypothetical protein